MSDGDRLTAEQAAAIAGRIRLRHEDDQQAAAILPSAGLYERLCGRPRGVSLAEASGVLRRSQYVDDALVRFLEPPIDAQVVLLLGDYDTRPTRLAEALQGRPVFACARAEAPGRVRVDPDAALPGALRAAGCRANERTIFVWEGEAVYRSRAAVKATLSAIRGMCGPGSVLVMDGWSPSPLQARPTLLGAPIRFAIHPEDLTNLLARMGFAVADVADAEELWRRFPPEGERAPGNGFVLTARLTGM